MLLKKLTTLHLRHFPVPCTQYTDQAANPVALTLQEFLEPGGAGTGDLLLVVPPSESP